LGSSLFLKKDNPKDPANAEKRETGQEFDEESNRGSSTPTVDAMND